MQTVTISCHDLRMRRLALPLSLGLLCACPGSDDDVGGSATTGVATTTTGVVPDSSDSGGSSTGLIGGDETTGEAIQWPPDDGLDLCMRECEGPWDCCPAGSTGQCPGTYPYNFECLGGYCVPAACESSAECTDGGSCEIVDGIAQCVHVCTGDGDCAATPDTPTCGAMTEAGMGYCIEHCEVAGTFCGNTTCDPASGRCVCEQGQCIAGWSCV